MDADIFVSGKKKLRIQKYPDTCGRGLTCFVIRFLPWLIIDKESVRNILRVVDPVGVENRLE